MVLVSQHRFSNAIKLGDSICVQAPIFASSLISNHNNVLKPHSSPPHVLCKTSTQERHQTKTAQREKLQKFPQVQLHPNMLGLGLHEHRKRGRVRA